MGFLWPMTTTVCALPMSSPAMACPFFDMLFRPFFDAHEHSARCGAGHSGQVHGLCLYVLFRQIAAHLGQALEFFIESEEAGTIQIRFFEDDVFDPLIAKLPDPAKTKDYFFNIKEGGQTVTIPNNLFRDIQGIQIRFGKDLGNANPLKLKFKSLDLILLRNYKLFEQSTYNYNFPCNYLGHMNLLFER